MAWEARTLTIALGDIEGADTHRIMVTEVEDLNPIVTICDGWVLGSKKETGGVILMITNTWFHEGADMARTRCRDWVSVDKAPPDGRTVWQARQIRKAKAAGSSTGGKGRQRPSNTA